MSHAPDLPPRAVISSGESALYTGTFGSMVIAIIASAFLFGVLTSQMYFYYNTYPSKDSLVLKFSIALIFTFDVAHFICIVEFTWWNLIQNWGDIRALTILRPSYGLYSLFGTIVILIVQLLFLYRITTLDKRLVYFSVPMFLLVIVEVVFGLYVACGFYTSPFVGAFENESAIGLISGVIVDIGISVVLSIFLHTKRSGFKRTDNLIKKIIVYSINTCALTSLVAVFNVVALYRSDIFYNAFLIFNTILPQLFSNSLLGSYNRRQELASEAEGIDTVRTEVVFRRYAEHEIIDANDISSTPRNQITRIGSSRPKPNWDVEMLPLPQDSRD